MEIVILSDYDSSGNTFNLASGVNRYTSHHATAVKLRVHPALQYPSMVVATDRNMKMVQQLVYDADAVVFKEFYWIADRYGLDMDRLRGKPMVGLMGGGGFRFERNRSPNLKFFKSHRMKIATTSADFLQHLNMAWIPPCVRYEEIRMKYDYSKTEPPLVFASPSKDTDIRLKMKRNFTRTMDELKRGGLNFSATCVSGADGMITNDECLRLKAKASIFFDRIYDIYGLNSQEAGAFEEAVITGTKTFALEKLREFGFNCPFIIVGDYLQARNEVRRLLKTPEFRTANAEACRAYVERLHSGRESAKRLVELLES